MQCSAGAADLVGQHVGAAAVEQDQVELLRPVAVAHAGPQRRVRVHPLGGRGARQQLQEDLEVLPRRQHLLDPHQRHQHASAASGTCARCPRTRRRRSCRSRRSRSSRPRPRPAPVRNFERRCSRAASAIAVASLPSDWPCAIVRSNSARISARLRWIAGTRMCDCLSPGASWTISSARSVSSAWMPCGLQRLVHPDLVRRQRLDLDDLVGAVRARDRRRRSRWPRRRRAPSARRRRRATTAASSRSSCSGSVAIVCALIASPASRSASQSGSSATARSRLAADQRRRLADVAAQLGVGQRDLARRLWKLIPGPPGSRRGASSARRCAGATARRRCASGTTCRPTCRPPRACRARAGPCRRASPSTCRRS